MKTQEISQLSEQEKIRFKDYLKNMVIVELASNKIQKSQVDFVLTDLGHDVDDHQAVLAKLIKAHIQGDDLTIILDGPNPPLEKHILEELVKNIKEAIVSIDQNDYKGIIDDPRDATKSDGIFFVEPDLIKKLKENSRKTKVEIIQKISTIISDPSNNDTYYSGIAIDASKKAELDRELSDMRRDHKKKLSSKAKDLQAQFPFFADHYFEERKAKYQSKITHAIENNLDINLTIICDIGIDEFVLINEAIKEAKQQNPNYQGNITIVTQGDALSDQDFNFHTIQKDKFLNSMHIDHDKKIKLLDWQKQKMRQILEELNQNAVTVICAKGDLNTAKNIGCASLSSVDQASNLKELQKQYQADKQQGWSNIAGVKVVGDEPQFFGYSASADKEAYFKEMTLASIIALQQIDGNLLSGSTQYPASQIVKDPSINLSSKRMTEVRAFFYKILTFEVEENGQKKEYKVQVDIIANLKDNQLTYDVKPYAEFNQKVEEIPNSVKNQIIQASKDTLKKICEERNQYEENLFQSLKQKALEQLSSDTQGTEKISEQLSQLLKSCNSHEEFKRNLRNLCEFDGELKATKNLDLIKELSVLINEKQKKYGESFFDKNFAFKSTSKISILYDLVAYQIEDFVSKLDSNQRQLFLKFLSDSSPKQTQETTQSQDNSLRKLVNARFVDKCLEAIKDDSIPEDTKNVLKKFIESLASTCENVLKPTQVIEKIKSRNIESRSESTESSHKLLGILTKHGQLTDIKSSSQTIVHQQPSYQPPVQTYYQAQPQVAYQQPIYQQPSQGYFYQPTVQAYPVQPQFAYQPPAMQSQGFYQPSQNPACLYPINYQLPTNHQVQSPFGYGVAIFANHQPMVPQPMTQPMFTQPARQMFGLMTSQRVFR